MIGNGGGEGDTERGVYALAARDLFEQCGDASDVVVTVSYFELYKGQLYDLLEVSHTHMSHDIHVSHSVERFHLSCMYVRIHINIHTSTCKESMPTRAT
jgi:hypothetical protein